MKNLVLLCILVGWLLPVSGLAAQTGGSWEIFQPLDLPNPDEGAGFTAVSIPDQDGDGIRELVIGSYLAEKPFLKGNVAYDSGSLDVYSGATGELLHRFWGGPRFGYAAMLGMALDDAGDVDGDGIPDLIGGAPMDLVGSGAAYVYSLSPSAPSKLIFRIDGANLTDHMGFAVAGLGDVDHDGFGEVASAGPMAQAGPLSGAGLVRVCSGPAGLTLWESWGPAAGAMFGHALAGAGDLDGDGAGDLIVAVPGLAQVHLLDGTQGQLLRILSAPPGVDGFGASVAGRTDLDGDGVPDVLVGADAIPGTVLAFSGADGALLFRIDGGPKDRIGFRVAFAGDVDGDGLTDILTGAPKADRLGLEANGAVFLYSGADQHLLQ
ncbi:MAG: FG-GAP repeat domain-containing protein, partial [Nitrospinota bacterium]